NRRPNVRRNALPSAWIGPSFRFFPDFTQERARQASPWTFATTTSAPSDESIFAVDPVPVSRPTFAPGSAAANLARVCSARSTVGVMKRVRTEIFEVIKMAISDRKSTRLNSSHGSISYAVFCLKKKKNNKKKKTQRT